MSGLCDPIDYSTPSFLVHHQLPELAQTHVHRVGNAIQPTISCSVVPFCLQSPSIRVFSNEHHQVAKVLGVSASASVPNEYSGLISFRIDWFDLAVQGTLKSINSVLSFIVQLNPYMTTEKTIPLTRRLLSWVVILFWVTSCPGDNLGLPTCRQILYCWIHHLFSVCCEYTLPPVLSPPYMVTGGVNGRDHLPHCNL